MIQSITQRLVALELREANCWKDLKKAANEESLTNLKEVAKMIDNIHSQMVALESVYQEMMSQITEKGN